jgi:hypothetical protein
MVLLVEWFNVSLAIAELPLVILFLHDVIIQCDGLIKQRLIVGCIGKSGKIKQYLGEWWGP